MDNRELRADARSDQRRLLVVLGLTSAYLLTELIGGYLTGSLALLYDAVHMLTDLAALSLGMGLMWIFVDVDALCWHDRLSHTYLADQF